MNERTFLLGGSMRTLVIGGTGTVGQQVVRELSAGVAGVVGDLQSPGTVRSIFAGIDAVFLLTALSQGEAHEGLLAVNGARMAGVKRIVAMTLQDPEGAPHVPHFGAKI